MTVLAFDFSHYLTYGEIAEFLDACLKAYPHLLERRVIGQSYEGRDIWVMAVTHQATGAALKKPGYWVDANTHAGEVTGSAVALYLLHKLVTQYGADPQITQLLDHHTVYILPRLAVDGAEKYLTTPYRLRSSVRPYPYPEERDGLYPEDVNGDGLILHMRLRDDCGAWKISEQDSRVMIRREPEEFGGEYYTLLPEGLIRNYDGYGFGMAPTLEGMDFNRNYPHLWAPENQQQGAGDFPFSEPETRAEAEFWQENRNINGFLSYHTYSAVFIRPYSTHPDEHFPTEDLEIYKLLGEKATRHTGYPCISSYHDFRYHPKEVCYGVMDDYGYDHYGWYGFTVELWDAPTQAGIKKNDFIQWFRWHAPEDDYQLLRWNDEELQGRGFIPWRPFEHPQLGPVEIGGWQEKAVWQNAPAQYLPEICEKQARLAINLALLSPRLALSQVRLTPQGGDIYHLVVQWENQGFLPTYTSKKALERKAVRPIEVSLSLAPGAKLISGHLHQDLPHLEGRSNKFYESLADGSDYRRHLEWVIQGPQGAPIQISAYGERCGTVVTSLTLGA
ncbi:MAG: M14 family metallopeptidase [Cyanobacteriota bacterium]|nr:M14 family metallopeptidase [Cyanobacteriota bacterium]